MKKHISLILHIVVVLMSLPFFAFSMFYTARWVIVGTWMHGGSDRAFAGFIAVILISLFHIPIAAYRDLTRM